MNDPSPRYFAALKATQDFHATHKTFNGRFFLRYLDEVKALVDMWSCKTLLDYGCGKGKQWEAKIGDADLGDVVTTAEDYLGVEVAKYDPGWPPFAADPQGKFDIVVCTQVLGSIPIVDLPWAVDRLYGFANKVVFVGERLGPVKKLVHAHMREEMPYEWNFAQWAETLRRPSRPDIACYLKATDGREGSVLGEYRIQ